ncbi:MAG TPA: class I SAM-dependent methyltransferase, partial [Chloroflexota bacterium]|nr:class I SAM-dependent methyltransferase [Chloroflexota bacterium]
MSSVSSLRARALEIGCGHGFNVSVLSRHKKVVGVDLSADNVAVARKRYPDCDFRVMDISKMEFGDCEFDECYALDVLEHVDDVDAVVSEVGRILRK